VPNLTPQLARELLRAHLDRRGFSNIRIIEHAGMVAARTDVQSDVVKDAVAAAREVYGAETVVYPSSGGSGPVHTLIQALGTPGAIMAGVGYADMRMHAPNESIRVEDYFRHLEFLVAFYRRFGGGS
jgi:acetylornithine deacetylase/succinyl-diaminopimelate desuccinylase-like protein